MMKQNHFFILAFLILALLGVVGCQVEQAPEPTEAISATSSSSATTSLTPAKTVTATPTQTYTPSPTLNPREFDASSIKTITPAAPAECPEIDPEMTFDGQIIKDLWSVDPHIDMFNKEVEAQNIYIEYLNQGGSFQSLLDGLHEAYSPTYGNGNRFVDVTGDNIQEVIFPRNMSAVVFTCKDQSYTEIGDLFAVSSLFEPGITLLDLNNNGLLEIVLNHTGCIGGKCFDMNVFEWNGIEFVDLLGMDCHDNITIPKILTYTDIDSNGTLEIIREYDYSYLFTDIDRYPKREETLVCMWNGNSFIPSDNYFSDPEYLFQAVQDGDLQMYFSNYEKAMTSYQQAINDDRLDWFTEERQSRDGMTSALSYTHHEPNPTATPVLFENPDEYPILASYSYYRIALIYLLLGDLDLVQITFDEQKTTFPVDQIGGEFTEITDILIQSYLNTENISISCNAVNDAVSKRSNQFSNYSNYFNYTSRFYQPSNLCPY